MAKICRTSPKCQKTLPGQRIHASLVPLPLVDTAFERIAMDKVGPLPLSQSGNKHILVMCDYATRYPEEPLLCCTDVEHVVEELLKSLQGLGSQRRY